MKMLKIIILVGLVSALVLPALALAGNPSVEKLKTIATVDGPYQGDVLLSDVIGSVVGVALSLLGIAFLLLMLYAGYNWLTAQGDEEKVTKAKNIIIQAVIGIFIVVGAYAAWMFVFSRLF